MRPIVIVVNVETYGPTRRSRARLVLDTNEQGEPRLRREMAPTTERDDSIVVHCEGVSVELEVEQ